MTMSAKSFLGDEDYCSPDQKSKCFAFIIFNLARLVFGCLPIIFIGDAAWSAFKKRRHWIPAGSLVVGALVIQFLSLLDKSFNLPGDVFGADHESKIKSLFNDMYEIPPSQNINYDHYISLIVYSNWVSVVCARVSMFVLMGCLLPGVARPLSGNVWRDMAALFISSSLSLLHISYETFRISKLEYFAHFFSLNLAMLVSLVVMLLLLVFAALASVSISKTWSHKIPSMILVQKLSTQVVWETVEERAIRSLIVARTGDPQYMLARSILSSSIALVITICNGILVLEICGFTYARLAYTFLDIWFVLRCVVIVMGSIIIYWRCITAVVFYPKARAKFFQIEEFWKSHLLDLIDSFNSSGYGGTSGKTSLGESIMSLMCNKMGLHKLLYVLHYLEMFCIFLSKLCWALTQLFFSQIIGSAYNKFRNLCKRKRHREGSLVKNTPDFRKYKKSLVVMEGESQGAIWMANRKSVVEIKEEMKKEDGEGKNCTDLISLLRSYSSPGFCGESCARLQICHHTVLEISRDLDVDVESELNVGKHSWKMTTVSIIAVIVELSTYIEDQSNAKNLVSSVMKACSQAWSIMDAVIEVSDGEAVEVSEAADNLFHSLEKERKWLDWCLPVNRPTQRTLTVAKKAMQSLFEKGKEKAMNIAPCDNGKKQGKHRKKKTDSRKWSERVAGYNMYKLGVHVNHQFPNVEAILNKLKGMLADVIGSCMVKVVGVIMEDFKKQASLYDEESILRLAGIAGKAKGVTQSLGWNLKWTTDEGTQSFKTSLEKDEVPAMKRRATFQMG